MMSEPIRLSRREAQCVELLCHGLSNREIAERLGLAETTITMHIRRARERLGARTREQAVAVAIVQRLIDVDALTAEFRAARPPSG